MKIQSELTNIEKLESGLQCIEMDYWNMKSQLESPELYDRYSGQELMSTLKNMNEGIDSYEFSMNILKKAIKAEEKKLQRIVSLKGVETK